MPVPVGDLDALEVFVRCLEGGIVDEEEDAAATRALVEKAGWRVDGVMPSPIAGGDGNQEFLLGAQLPMSAEA